MRETIHAQLTPLQRITGKVRVALTEEGLMSDQYFDEAEAGASLISVLAPDRRLVDESRQILDLHGARCIEFYGGKSIIEF